MSTVEVNLEKARAYNKVKKYAESLEHYELALDAEVHRRQRLHSLKIANTLYNATVEVAVTLSLQSHLPSFAAMSLSKQPTINYSDIKQKMD